MLDFESARQHFVSAAIVLEREVVPLSQALGRVLAEPIVAHQAIPPFDTSAMDGYAIYVDDSFRVPYCLRVSGEAPAGSAPALLSLGTAMRIFTGASVPEGANAVVMQEHVQRETESIRGDKPVTIGQNIRRRGEDLEASLSALKRGARLHPGALCLASFLDYSTLTVSRAPRVSILCTGSELRQSGSEGHLGTIAESNSITIAALARQAGATVGSCTIVADDADAIRHSIESALEDSDVLITIGGVSVGDYDYVRPALQSASVTVELHEVAIKPGKPITLGRRERKVVIGLPGNPTSAIITFSLFGLPLLRAMQADNEPIPLASGVRFGAELKRDPKRTRLILGSRRAVDGQLAFVPHANQSSGATIALGQSEGFVIVAAGESQMNAGITLPFHRWSDL